MVGGKGMWQEWGMWQGVGACDIVTYLACDKGKGHMAGGWGHVAGTGDMWQGIGAYGRGWLYMAGDGGMWQGLGTCCRGWWHVAGCGSCDRGGACGRGWGHVLRARGISKDVKCQKVKHLYYRWG